MNIENSYPILRNRPYQIEVIKKLLDSDKKYVILDSPTGSGKTLIALIYSDIMSNYGISTHIAVRTTEQIKRYVIDSEKINRKIKIFPNKRKTCTVFVDTNLSGEEISCSECQLRKILYDDEKLLKRLKKAKYDFELLTKIEKIRLKKGKSSHCIYHSFKKIDSNIIVTTYPYVFNPYLNELIYLENNPSILILDEAHNLLTTIINPISYSLKKYVMKGLNKKGKENPLFEELYNELEIIFNVIKVPYEDKLFIYNKLEKFCDDLLGYLEDKIKKHYKTDSSALILERLKTDLFSREIYIDYNEFKEIFSKHRELLEYLSEYWEVFKKAIIKQNLNIKKRWNINKIFRLYNSLEEEILLLINNLKLEGYETRFSKIIKQLDNYDKVILMSGSNFNDESFSKLYKIKMKDIEYIKVNVKIGEKEFLILDNYTSSYRERKEKKNVENLIGNIKFIYNNFDKYQLFMFPSFSYLNFIYEKLDIKDKIFLDDGEVSLNKILDTDKEIIFTYARSRFIEGIELVKNNRSLLKTIVIVGKPYPPPPNASILTQRLIKDNDLNYEDFSETIKDIQIKQVIGRALRYPDDKVKVIFIDRRYKPLEIKKYL